MFVRAVKGDQEKTFECTHISKKTVQPGSLASTGSKEPGMEFRAMQPGIYIEMVFPDRTIEPITIHIPSDADVVYLMSSQNGKTAETIRWNPDR